MLIFLFWYKFLYKHIKFQGLGSDMFKATLKICLWYAYIRQKMFKMKSYSIKILNPATFLKINSSTDIFLGFCFNILVVLYYILEC